MTEGDSPNLYESDKPGTAERTRAEFTIEGLRSRGGVFVEAVRATRMAMVLTDPSLPGNPIVFANESFLALSGYDRDEVLGQQPYFLNGPDTDEGDAARFRDALAQDHDETLQTIQYAKDGSRMVVSLFLTALKDDDGRTLHHLLSWRDITRQVEAEDKVGSLRAAQERLRESEEKYRTLFEKMQEGFSLLERVAGKPVDYRYLAANPAFERHTGWTNPVGKTIRETTPGVEDAALESYRNVEETGLSQIVVTYVPDLHRWFEVEASSTDQPGQIAVLFRDITDRKRAEAESSEREQRQAFLLRLSDALRAEPSAESMANRALQMLLEQMRLDRCWVGIYRLEEDAGEFPHQVHDDALPPLPDRVRLSDFPKALEVAFDRTLVINNVAEMDGLSEDDRASFEGLGTRALIASTLRKGENNPLWAINIASVQPRAWTQSEVTLVEEVTERTWAAIERARAEAALRESEQRYRRVFFSNMTPMAVWTKSGAVAEANDALLELLGYTRAELEAGKLRWDEITPAEYRELDVQAIAEVEAKGFCTPYEKVFYHKDGRPISIIIGGGSLDETAGTGVFFAFDLTERKRAEQELATRELQFETLLNQAPLGVYLVDGDFVIRQVNPVALPVFGDVPGGPVGRDFDEVIHILWDKDYADEVVRIFRHTLETGEPYITAERAEHRSDLDIIEYYEWRIDRIMLPDGRYGVVCYFRDISAQVHARQEIERANELARESEERLAIDLADTRVLQAAGAAMIDDSSGDHAEQAILSAAVAIMRSDCASIQMLDPATNQLVLLGHIGFHPDSARFWDRVTRDSSGTCGQAFNECRRIIIEDVRENEIIRHSEDLQSYRKSGIVAVQTTPLVTRAGKLIGMMSTHWREPHRPDERQFGHFDVLVRQAADLLEWRSTAAALRKSEERLRLIVESARDYAIFTVDRDDIIDEWLPGAQQVFGYSKEEAEGRPSAILYTPEDRQNRQPEKEVETARREGKAADVRWHLRKGGDRVFIEGQMVPLTDAVGEVQGFLKIGQDVTERRLAEEALRESEERFRQFGEASSDLLWIRDAETLAFEYLSPAFDRLYGVPREQILAGNDVKAWAELIHPDDREGALDMLRKLRGGLPGSFEFRVVRPDGSMSWLHDTNFPLRDDSGAVVRIAGIAHDITDRKHAVEFQGTLLAELQHRVRNILALIQSVVRRTGDSSESPEDYARHLGGRIAAMARTQAMITRSPTRNIDLEEVLRDELLSVAASETQHWAEGPQVALPPKAAEVFTLAIHELATNSVKYGALSDRPGQLEIRWDLEARDGQAWLVFEWEESRVKHTGFSREGFGTELITRRVPYELRGKGSIEPAKDGMIAKLEFPIVRSNSILETIMPEQLH